MKERLRVVIPVLLILAVGTWAGVAYLGRHKSASDVVLASGTIEALQVSIASKIPGRIERLLVDEGNTVRAGSVLVTIEGREVQAQLEQARAALDATRAGLEQARAALAMQQQQVESSVAQAQAVLDAARARVPQAQETEALTAAQSSLAVAQAEAALQTSMASSTAAKANLEKAAADLTRLEPLYKEGAISAQQLDAARAAKDAAQGQYEASQRAVRHAEATLNLARANQRQVEIRQRDVTAAQAQVRQAEAALRTAQAGELMIVQRRAGVAAAEAQVAQAQANVQYLLAQQRNLVITSPIDGVVISKHANVGEIVGAGVPVLTVADLDQVWIRLFIPLPRLGEVALGQRAEVTTDALSGESFTGKVTEINQQAEFTPKNVQTREERVKLVFAVKVRLSNPKHRLKPGMPADAVIKVRE